MRNACLRTPSRAVAFAMLLAATTTATAETQAPKVGVLLANHGSHSPAWRASLLQVERSVRDTILASGLVHGVKTAFMEYTEPSIATAMKQFDAEGYSDVIVVPLFLTVSAHTFDDIPTILGRKQDPQSLQYLKLERIERYTPRARTHFGPRLDVSTYLKQNVLRRARALSREPTTEGLVLIAYGDKRYEKQWAAFLEEVASHVLAETGMRAFAHGWAGHLVGYDPSHTTRAIEQVLRECQRAVVVPVFVAFDEMFQVDIIGRGIAAVAGHETRVAYTPDAILPDERINAWVAQTAIELAASLGAPTAVSRK